MKTRLSVIILTMVMVIFISCRSKQPIIEPTALPGSVVSDSTRPSEKGLIIIDVRTVEEWNEDGHASCTMNYPLDILESKVDDLAAYRQVWVVCRSGHRAGVAKEILEERGLKQVVNKGSWQEINCEQVVH